MHSHHIGNIKCIFCEKSELHFFESDDKNDWQDTIQCICGLGEGKKWFSDLPRGISLPLTRMIQCHRDQGFLKLSYGTYHNLMQTLFDLCPSTIVLPFVFPHFPGKKAPQVRAHIQKNYSTVLRQKKNLILHCDVRTRVQRTISRKKKTFFFDCTVHHNNYFFCNCHLLWKVLCKAKLEVRILPCCQSWTKTRRRYRRWPTWWIEDKRGLELLPVFQDTRISSKWMTVNDTYSSKLLVGIACKWLRESADVHVGASCCSEFGILYVKLLTELNSRQCKVHWNTRSWWGKTPKMPRSLQLSRPDISRMTGRPYVTLSL